MPVALVSILLFTDAQAAGRVCHTALEVDLGQCEVFDPLHPRYDDVRLVARNRSVPLHTHELDRIAEAVADNPVLRAYVRLVPPSVWRPAAEALVRAGKRSPDGPVCAVPPDVHQVGYGLWSAAAREASLAPYCDGDRCWLTVHVPEVRYEASDPGAIRTSDSPTREVSTADPTSWVAAVDQPADLSSWLEAAARLRPGELRRQRGSAPGARRDDDGGPVKLLFGTAWTSTGSRDVASLSVVDHVAIDACHDPDRFIDLTVVDIGGDGRPAACTSVDPCLCEALATGSWPEQSGARLALIFHHQKSSRLDGNRVDVWPPAQASGERFQPWERMRALSAALQTCGRKLGDDRQTLQLEVDADATGAVVDVRVDAEGPFAACVTDQARRVPVACTVTGGPITSALSVTLGQ